MSIERLWITLQLPLGLIPNRPQFPFDTQFILISVQIAGVMDKLHLYSLSELCMPGRVITVVAIAVRFA